MKIFRIVMKVIGFLYFLGKTGSYKFSYLLADEGLPLKVVRSLAVKNSQLIFMNTGNKIFLSHVSSFKYGLTKLIFLLNNERINITDEEKDSFTLTINSIRHVIKSLNNLNIIHELYFEKLYNIQTPFDNFIVTDIGMNVGFASLYFASLPDVSKVYSFEPFLDTYDAACKNFNLNPSIKNKITPFNEGISNFTGHITVPTLEAGSVMASTNKEFIKDYKIDSSKKSTVQIKNITEVIQEIKASHPEQKIYLKIDCEGEEYNIINRLNDSKLIQIISGFIIEWHFKGPDLLVAVLKENGFSLLEVPIHSETIYGMIYAFKN